MIDLTIAIPTYRRKDKLLNQLHAIYRQQRISEAKVLVIDNHSDYNVSQVIRSEFSEETLSNLEIVVHPFNIGLALNIGMPFYYCKTKWLWIVSDDDLLLDGSLNIVAEDIEDSHDEIAIKYSILHRDIKFPAHKDVSFDSIDDIVAYYKANKYKGGEFIFISNGVFNIERLQPIMGDVFAYSYNALAGINPICFGLDKKLGKCRFSSNRIVEYKSPAPGTDWSFYTIGNQVANLLDYPFNCSGSSMYKLSSMLNYMDFDKFMSVCENFHDRYKAKIFYETVFNRIFLVDVIHRLKFKITFYILFLFGYNIRPIEKKLYDFFKIK